MNLITIILFFIYTLGLGYSVTRFVKTSNNLIEKNLMNIGVGLGVFAVLGNLLNLLRIPLDWKIFFILSIIFPAYDLYKNYNKLNLKFKLTKTNLIILVVLLMFFLTFFMYHKGAFAYPWLEDSDPWGHAKAAKYIATEKTAFEPEGLDRDFFQYIDAYPPSYSILMGILSQTSLETMWNLKFFNALILALGIVFFFFFAKEFVKDKTKALFATFILVAIPSYMSHFIWSLTLSVPLYFVAFYSVKNIKKDKKWIYIATIITAAILVTQLTTAVKFGLFLGIYWFIKSIINKKIDTKIISIGILALLIAFIIWWGPMFIKWGYPDIITKGLHQESVGNVIASPSFLFTMNDFFSAPKQNKINNPIGIGPILFPLFLLSIILILFNYKKLLYKEYDWKLIALLWAILGFLMIHGGRLPIRMDAHRSWMLFAIPVALLSVEGLYFLMNLGKKVRIDKILVVSVLVILILVTSAYPKYVVNTALWPPDSSFTSQEEIQGYVWMQNNIPKNSNVFVYANAEKSIAYDMYSCEWCEDVYNFRKDMINKNFDEFYSFLKSKDYEYFVIGGNAFIHYGAQLGQEKAVKILNEKINEIVKSGKFQIVHQTEGLFIFKIL